MKRRRARVAMALLLAASLCLIGFTYSYKISLSPAYTADEVGLLMIPERFAEYGDLRYPLIYSESYNNHGIRKYPPITAFLLRALYQRVVGFSATKSRWFSALLLLSVVIAIWAALRRSGAGALTGVAGALLVGLDPGVVMAARTTRFEQEVVFLGAVACIMVPLLLKTGASRRNTLLWFLAGGAAGWAATSHVWGWPFVIVPALCVLLSRRGWAQLDGLAFGRRALFWAAGLAIPVAVTVYSMLQGWPQYLHFVRSLSALYAVRTEQFVQFYLGEYPSLVNHLLPARVAAAVHELSRNAYATENYPPIGQLALTPRSLYVWVFWLELLALLAVGRDMVRRQSSPRGVLVQLSWALGVGFVLLTLAYPPNTTYYLYSTLFVAWAFCMAYASAPEWRRPGVVPGAARVRAERVVFAAALAASLLFSGAYLRYLQVDVSTSNRVSLDTVFDTLETMADRVGLWNVPGPIYTDTLAWPAGGYDVRSIQDVIAGASTRNAAGAAFDGGALDFLVDFFPAVSGTATTEREKARRISRLLGRLALDAVVVDRPTHRAYFLYGRKTQAKHPPRLAIIGGDSKVLWYDATSVVAPETSGQGRDRELLWSGLPAGAYLLVGRGSPEEQAAILGGLSLDRTRAGTPCGAAVYKRAPACIIIQNRRDGGDLRLMGKGGALALELLRLGKARVTGAPHARYESDDGK